jgi:hypothetical protein
MSTYNPTRYTVIGDGVCETYCRSLEGAIKSAGRFHPDYKSIKIWHRGVIVHVVR